MISAEVLFFQLLLLNHGSHRPIHDQDALAGELLQVLRGGRCLEKSFINVSTYHDILMRYLQTERVYECNLFWKY